MLICCSGINIRFMNVAALEHGNSAGEGEREDEALMILGVEGKVEKGVEEELRGEKGILDVSVVRL